MDHVPFDSLFADGFAIDGRVTVAGQDERACRAVFFAPDRALIATEAAARTGQEAICYLDAIGALPGRIGGGQPGGFVLHLSLSEARTARIAARLLWRVEQRGRTVEQRADPRIVPQHRAVVVRLPDGSVVEGRIDNLSKSGALVTPAAPVPLRVGAGVTLGKRHATVVRLQRDAIAVQFRLPFCDLTFHPGLVL